MEKKVKHDVMLDGRVPSAKETEDAVLALILTNCEDATDALVDLREDDFCDTSNKKLFEVVRALHNNGHAIDIVSVVDHIKFLEIADAVGGIERVAHLACCSGVGYHLQDYIDVLRAKSIQRRLMAAGSEIMQDAAHCECDVQTLVAMSLSRMDDACAMADKHAPRLVGDAMQELMQEVLSIQSGKMTCGIWTKYNCIDRYIAPLRGGEYIIIGARTSRGKTQFAVNLAYNIASAGTPVAYFSLEMTDKSVSARIMTMLTGISATTMNTVGMDEKSISALVTATKKMQQLPIFVDETSAIPIAYLRNKAKRLVRIKKVGLIIVDYLQLISYDSKTASTHEQEVAYISRNLKAMAKELDVPVIALAQLSRNAAMREASVVDAEPKLSDLRESGSIEQDADKVILIHRTEREVCEGSEKTTMIIAKNRNGKVGKIDMKFDAEYVTFREVEVPNDGEVV